MSKPKIAILINSMKGGGAERTVAHILNGFQDRYDIHLLLFYNEVDYELPAGQKVAVLDGGPIDAGGVVNLIKLPKLASRIKEYCEHNNIELLLSFLPRANFAACMAKRKGMRIPLLISERTYTPAFHRSSGIAGRISSLLVKRLYPFADAVLPNSERTSEALTTEYGLRNAGRVVRNILDLEMIHRLAAESVDSPFPDRGFTFIHVGSFSYMKGHAVMIEAFAGLPELDCRMVFVGDGPLLTESKDLARSLGITDRILFLGHTGNPFKYLKQADCFVFASDFEGFPNAMLEAMACGLPVVSTDCPTGPRELIGPSAGPIQNDLPYVERCRSGLLVPVRDTSGLRSAMNMILTNTDLRAEFAGAARERAKEFDKSRVLGEIAGIIDGYLQPA